jgi:3-methyladenine DNA glycosylase/8-oxoguanine DNA glycosylase
VNVTRDPRFRAWIPGRPVPVALILSSLHRGPGDPCLRVQPDGVLWRATRNEAGDVLLRLEPRPGDASVHAHAWGPGADAALAAVPELLGDDDDPSGFTPSPEHPRLVAAARAHPHWRVTRTRAVFEALAAAALEQRVTGAEAHRAWRMLVTAYGDLAPGPAGTTGTVATGMRVCPPPQRWLSIPQWEWLRAGVDEQRRRTVVGAAAVAHRLERTVGLGGEEAARALRVVPGVGVWTAAEVRQRAHGDPDAFSWADFHVAKDVSWALAGEVLDDPGCAALVERYRGHRYRVQRLLELAGATRPRRAPRMTLPTHLPVVPRFG